MHYVGDGWFLVSPSCIDANATAEHVLAGSLPERLGKTALDAQT